MSNNFASLRKSRHIKCKYPLHGTKNVLKYHVGRIERVGTGPNGRYAVVRSMDQTVRTLLCDKMIETKCYR
jgi:hypothetical protein